MVTSGSHPRNHFSIGRDESKKPDCIDPAYQLLSGKDIKVMTLCFSELRNKIGNSGVIYPSEFFGKIEKYPDGIVQPGSVLVEDTPIPALFFVCPEADIDFLNIKIPLPQPEIRYRYLEMEFVSVIEIHLKFPKDKELIFHLNPSAKLVRDFLYGGINNGIVSLHFICATRNILGSSFVEIDTEEMAWYQRNYQRALNMKKIPDSLFLHVSKSLASSFKSNQKYYKFSGKKGRR